MAALRRFSDNLAKLPEDEWGKPLSPDLRIVFQHLPDDNHPGITHLDSAFWQHTVQRPSSSLSW